MSTDFVILLIFVLTSVVWYKAFINGAYYGVALHIVSETYNGSYDYASGSDEHSGEPSSETKYKISDDEDDLILDLDREMQSMKNPENRGSNGNLKAASKSIHSERNRKALHLQSKDSESDRVGQQIQSKITKRSRTSKGRPREIQFNEQKLLGKGSGGTCVFEGKHNGRIVAVKRMIHQHQAVAQLEIDFLQRVDHHKNLLTYFHKE